MTGPVQAILSEPIPLTRPAEDELEVAVREHARFVYKVVYAVLENHHDAEDAVQETFVRLLRSRKRWAEVRDRRAWLARMAWRVALDRSKRRPEVGIEEAASAVRELRAQGVGAEEIAANRQMMAILSRLIAALPRDLRDAVILSAVQELTSAEIAGVLRIPESSVRTRLHRARELLREKLSALLECHHGR